MTLQVLCQLKWVFENLSLSKHMALASGSFRNPCVRECKKT